MRKAWLAFVFALVVAGVAAPFSGADGPAEGLDPAPLGPSATARPAGAGRQDLAGNGYAADPVEERQRRAATSEAACVTCHEKARPELVRGWRESRHAASGVGCSACHGVDHSTLFGNAGQVSAATCAACHKEAGASFARSGHARSMDNLVASPRFLDEPAGLREATCVACHRIGEHDRLDGSAGRCNACHESHAFSAAAARRPDACATCHSGPGHPQNDAFAASKHGALLAAGQGAPSCASCHMAGGAHDTQAFVTTEEGLGSAARDARRAAAVASCAPCHATRFAAESLATGDAARADVDAILARARAVIEALDHEGLLRPGAAGRGGKPVVLGPPGQLEHGATELERRYFKMWREYGQDCWKATYHQGPTVAQGFGRAKLRDAAAWVEEEAARLRAAAAGSAKTAAPPAKQ